MEHSNNSLKSEKQSDLNQLENEINQLRMEMEIRMQEKLKLREKLEKLSNEVDKNSKKSVGFLLNPSSLSHISIACQSCESLCKFCIKEEKISPSSFVNFLQSNRLEPKKNQSSISCNSIAFCENCRSLFAQSYQSVNSSVSTKIPSKSISGVFSCCSHDQCKLCRNGQVTNLGETPIMSTCLSRSTSNQYFTEKNPNIQKKQLQGLKDSNAYLPTSDIIYSIFYSTTNVPKAVELTSQKSKSSIDKDASKTENFQVEEGNEEIIQTPYVIKPKKVKYDENSCPKGEEEELATPGETPSQIMEKHHQERLKKEEEKRKIQQQKSAKAYENFLSQQSEKVSKNEKNNEKEINEEEEKETPKIQCGFIDDCVIDCEENQNVSYSENFSSMKYEIELQNYKISKLCQEVKSKQGGPNINKIKGELKKEIEKLNNMIDYIIQIQMENPNDKWGTIPISSASITQLERRNFEFQKVSMPKKESKSLIKTEIVTNFKEYQQKKEKEKLIKNLEKKMEEKRRKCLTTKSQKLMNEVAAIKQFNEEFTQKQKFFDSERAEFNPDEKMQEVQDTLMKLMSHLNSMKTEFDDIHKKLHEKSK